MGYTATNDDLPDFLFTGKKPVAPEVDVRRQAEVAVQAHFPVISEKRQRQLDRAFKKSQNAGVQLREPKIFVKLAKKRQMFDWLKGLEQTFPAMNFRERDLCEKLLIKFRKYKPEKSKWVTEAQYQWTKKIAATYIMLPQLESFSPVLCRTGKAAPCPSQRLRKPTTRIYSRPTTAALRARSAANGSPTGSHWLTTLGPLARKTRGRWMPTLAIEWPLKPDQVNKLRVTAILPDGYSDSRYVCECGRSFVRRLQILKHLGMVPNIPASCAKYYAKIGE